MLVVAIPPVSVFSISFSAATPLASAILLHSAMLPTVTFRLPESSFVVPNVVDPVKVVVGPGVVVTTEVTGSLADVHDAKVVGAGTPVTAPTAAATSVVHFVAATAFKAVTIAAPVGVSA